MGSFPFMKLPLELRDKVYSYGLMVEGHITPYPEYYHYRRNLDCKGDKLRSFIGILSLSKAVHEEAAVIFYGKNTFRVSSMAKELALDYMMHDATGPEKSIKETLPEEHYPTTLWTQKGHLIRQAVVYYHYNDYDHTRHAENSLQPLHDSAHDPTVHVDTLHDSGVYDMHRSWRGKLFHLWQLQNLTTLGVNLTDLYCPMGCCRLETLHSFCTYRFFPSIAVPDAGRIVLEGLKSKEEMALIKDVRDRAPKSTIDIFPPQE